MADFTALKTAIQTYIKQNGNEEITGNILQEVLLSVVTTLGDSAINDLITALGNEVTARQQADGTLQQNITNEATARGNADTALQGLIDGITGNIENGYVYAGIATPSSTPTTGKVFYLALTAGTYTNFDSTVVSQGINILKYNGSAWSLDTSIGIDDTPTAGSENLVKSGGVAGYVSVSQNSQTKVDVEVGGDSVEVASGMVADKLIQFMAFDTTSSDEGNTSYLPFDFVIGKRYILRNTSTNGTTINARTLYNSSDAETIGNGIAAGTEVEFTPTIQANVLRIYWSQIAQPASGEIECSIRTDMEQEISKVETKIEKVVFDISQYNNGTEYATLSSALAAVPNSFKSGGGHIIKYIDSNHKYHFFANNSNQWSDSPSTWEHLGIGVEQILEYQTSGTSYSMWTIKEGYTYTIKNKSSNTRRLVIYLHTTSNTDVWLSAVKNGESFSFVMPENIQYINVYCPDSGFEFSITISDGLLGKQRIVEQDIKQINETIGELGKMPHEDYAVSGTSQSFYSFSVGATIVVENISTDTRNFAVYFHYTNGNDMYIGTVYNNEKLAFVVDSGVQYVLCYSSTSVFGVRVYYPTNTYAASWQAKQKAIELGKFWRELPELKVLILGDSYSIWGSIWYQYMVEKLYHRADVKSLAVSSATIKDKYTDRTTYPYTSRPSDADNSGNKNTLACQIEKLKRLMAGTDLDEGETQWYANASDYPNIIIIEGGQNDSFDSPEVEATYYEQFETLVQNAKCKEKDGAAITTEDVYIKTPIDNVNRTCFAGAYRYLLEELMKLFPNAQVFFTTVCNLGYWIGSVAEKRDKEAVQQRKCAGLCSASVIDWHRDAQINTIENYPTGSGTTEDPYMWGQGTGLANADTNDAMHPNTRGGKKLGKVAANAIITHYMKIE